MVCSGHLNGLVNLWLMNLLFLNSFCLLSIATTHLLCWLERKVNNTLWKDRKRELKEGVLLVGDDWTRAAALR